MTFKDRWEIASKKTYYLHLADHIKEDVIFYLSFAEVDSEEWEALRKIAVAVTVCRDGIRLTRSPSRMERLLNRLAELLQQAEKTAKPRFYPQEEDM